MQNQQNSLHRYEHNNFNIRSYIKVKRSKVSKAIPVTGRGGL
jgi:hypothetical protein